MGKHHPVQLLLVAAAAVAAAPSVQKTAAGWESTMPLKDELVPKPRQKTP